eukprot:scaffold6128_cov42-Prasinocladus_malaysianus.AAC.1
MCIVIISLKSEVHANIGSRRQSEIADWVASLLAQISEKVLELVRDWTPKVARELGVVGLMNIQYAVKDEELYIIEANPRASRTVPFVAKAVGQPIATYASLIMSGKTLAEINFTEEPKINHVA